MIGQKKGVSQQKKRFNEIILLHFTSEQIVKKKKNIVQSLCYVLKENSIKIWKILEDEFLYFLEIILVSFGENIHHKKQELLIIILR